MADPQICNHTVTISANGSVGRAHEHSQAFAPDVSVRELRDIWQPDPVLFLHMCNEIDSNVRRFDSYRNAAKSARSGARE